MPASLTKVPKAMDHLDPIRRRIGEAAIASPPQPWVCLASHAVGGLTEIGFADDTDLLLVVSSQGRGVFDCLTGERVARDRDECDDDCYDERRLRARGIGPLNAQSIRLAGLHGGGLPNGGRDGWSIAGITLEWPVQHVLLIEQWKWIYDDSARITKLAEDSEIRAFGFSDTGNSFVIATSSDLAIYCWKG
ncbi:MAG TPA: hypothetical protein VHK01_12395 [Lacipirellulaceae bacterium]|nr:hypothetical protein [Lacipirellulaceae bacterium]